MLHLLSVLDDVLLSALILDSKIFQEQLINWLVICPIYKEMACYRYVILLEKLVNFSAIPHQLLTLQIVYLDRFECVNVFERLLHGEARRVKSNDDVDLWPLLDGLI